MDVKVTVAVEEFWRTYRPALRGEYDGRCNNALCSGIGARWYNVASTEYYCEDCARRINQECRQQGRRLLCELHD